GEDRLFHDRADSDDGADFLYDRQVQAAVGLPRGAVRRANAHGRQIQIAARRVEKSASASCLSGPPSMPTSSSASPIHGVCPVLATPLQGDGAPDAPALARAVEFAI